MARPILLVGIPFFGNVSRQEKYEEITQTHQCLIEQANDEYWILVYELFGQENPKFEVFYEKNFNEVKYEELKSIVEGMVNKKPFEVKKEWIDAVGTGLPHG